MKVNILGAEYTVVHSTPKENKKLEGANGIAELYSKEIVIDSEMEPPNGEGFSNFEAFKQKVLRHEIIHCFLHESGLHKYCRDEDLVEALAIQIPKMVKAMNETKCL